MADLKVTEFPPLSQFALAAHIWVPVILLLTVTFVTWLKLRNPKTPWPKVITFLVGFVLAGIVVVGLHEPIEKATARADSLWKKPQRDEHPHP